MESFSASPNYFTAYTIDRIQARQGNERWIEEQLADPTTRFVPVWHAQNLFDQDALPHALFLSRAEIAPLVDPAQSPILLGEVGGHLYFAVDVPDEATLPPHLAESGTFLDLRNIGALIGQWEGALLAYAKAMVHWHRQNRFCGVCGSPTVSDSGGHRRLCTDPRCGQAQFPRTDPAIIVLVTSGERCLLGRQAIWAAGRYSTIAGFVEPGESLEDAVVREVLEETGIQTCEVSYCSSQPWPFPTSLMVGFYAHGINEEIHLNDGELEDARWFTRDEIQSGLEAGTFHLPSLVSISYRLIEGWFNAENPIPLKEIRCPD